MTRFDMNATDREGARAYLMARALQVLADGFRLVSDVEPLVENEVEWGCRIRLRSGDGVLYQSVYTYAQHRKQGYTTDFLHGSKCPVLTSPDCHLEGYLEHIRVPYLVVAHHVQWPEYRLISRHYEDKAAARSHVPYMNHIDEGLVVLRRMGASQEAQRAYCLHPIFQSDDDLNRNFLCVDMMLSIGVHMTILALTMEYRNIANATLSRREISGADDIPLSPLEDVNYMLRADKVQNYKDFLLYHARTHERRAALDRYFRLWLERLNVAEDEFAVYFEYLQVGGHPVLLKDVQVGGATA